MEILTRRALGGPRVIGWDVTIYNPDLDPTRAGAERIVHYLSEALGALGPNYRRGQRH